MLSYTREHIRINETSGSIKYGKFFYRFCGCRLRTALHLGGYSDCHYRSFR